MTSQPTDNPWKDPWFRKLTPGIKLAWWYITSHCDKSGVWDGDTDIANFIIGVKIPWVKVKDVLGDKIEVVEGVGWKIKGIQPATRKPAVKCLKTSDLETDEAFTRIAALYHRKPTTAWSEREIEVFKKLQPIDLNDLALVEKYVNNERAKGDGGIHRRDLSTFLNNYNGEVDRARQASLKQPTKTGNAEFTQFL